MNHQTIERLINIMNANKIKFNKQFKSVLEHGFTDEARENFFEEIIDDLDALLRHGINSEFNKSMKEAITSLVDLAVKTGEEHRRSATLERLRFEKRNCMSSLKSTKEYQPEFDLIGNLRQYVESTKDGMELLQENDRMRTSAEAENMKLCRNMLDDVLCIAEDVTDVSGTKAVECYNQVITQIHDWRVKVARSGGLYDSGAVMMLKNVVNTMHEWAKLCVSTFLHKGKIQDVYGVPTDDLTHAIESVSIRENIEMFLNHCEVYAEETARMRNDAVSEHIMDLNTQIRNLGDREKEVVRQFKAQQIHRDEAEYALQKIKEKREELQFEIDRKKIMQISYEQIKARREMLLKIETPIRQSYAIVKSNRLHIYTLFSGIDFARLVGMINNNVSTQDFTVGIQEMQRVLVSRGIIDEQGKVQTENIRQQLALVDEVKEQNSLLDSALGQEKEESGSLLDALLARDEEENAKENVSATPNKNISDIF